MKNKNLPEDEIPPIPQRILDGTEPMADRYKGNWEPVESNAPPVTPEELARVTDEMHNAITAASAPDLWPGKVYALAQSIETRHAQGEFGEISLEKAFEWAAGHYIQSNGKPFTARSLRESLRTKKERA